MPSISVDADPPPSHAGTAISPFFPTSTSLPSSHFTSSPSSSSSSTSPHRRLKRFTAFPSCYSTTPHTLLLIILLALTSLSSLPLSAHALPSASGSGSRAKRAPLHLLSAAEAVHVPPEPVPESAAPSVYTADTLGPNTGKTAAVIVSEGRAGSTLLMSLLSLKSDSFTIAEPYFNFMTAAMRPKAPTFSSLLDCSFLDTLKMARLVYWKYACKRSTYFIATKRVDICIAGRINEHDREMLSTLCRRSSLRILKVIRSTHFSESFPAAINATAWTTKVLHIVRRPWSIIRSQYAAGWDADTSIVAAGGTPLNDDERGSPGNKFQPSEGMEPKQIAIRSVQDFAKSRCRAMNQQLRMISFAAAPERVMRVHYEDFIDHPSWYLMRFLDFLQQPCPECTAARILEATSSSQPHMPRNHRNLAQLTYLTDSQWDGNIQQLPPCQRIYFTLGYSNSSYAEHRQYYGLAAHRTTTTTATTTATLAGVRKRVERRRSSGQSEGVKRGQVKAKSRQRQRQ